MGFTKKVVGIMLSPILWVVILIYIVVVFLSGLCIYGQERYYNHPIWYRWVLVGAAVFWPFSLLWIVGSLICCEMYNFIQWLFGCGKHTHYRDR